MGRHANRYQDNRPTLDQDVIQMLEERGYEVKGTSNLSKTVNAFIRESCKEIFEPDLKMYSTTNLQSLRKTVTRQRKHNEMYVSDIPKELESFAKSIMNSNTFGSSLLNMCEDGIAQCPLLFDYLARLCFGRKYKSKGHLDSEELCRKRLLIGLVIHYLANATNIQCTNMSTMLCSFLYAGGVSSWDITMLSKISLVSAYTTMLRQLDKYIFDRINNLRSCCSTALFVYSDNLEFATGKKYCLGDKQDELIHTITSICRAIPNSPSTLQIKNMNADLLSFKCDLSVVLKKVHYHHSTIYEQSVKYAVSLLKGVEEEKPKKTKHFIEYDCFPSFLGNGASNKDKTDYIHHLMKLNFQKEVDCVMNGDQVFASFLHRAHRHGHVELIWCLAGDWHFHQLDLQCLLRHGWCLFGSLTEALDSKVTIECKDYNSMYAFINTFTLGMSVWLMKCFINSNSIQSSVVEWTDSLLQQYDNFVKSLRSKIKTIDVVCHLMELGLDNLCIKKSIRRNDANSLRLLWSNRLRLFLCEGRRNYFQLASYQVHQHCYLQQHHPQVLSFLDENRGVSMTGNNYMGNDEFTEWVHAGIKSSRIARDEDTLSIAIQRTVYIQQHQRQLQKGTTQTDHSVAFELTKEINGMVDLLTERVGTSADDIYKNWKTRHPNPKACTLSKLVDIFRVQGVNATVIKDDPMVKYNSLSDQRLIQRFNHSITNVPKDPTISENEEGEEGEEDDNDDNDLNISQANLEVDGSKVDELSDDSEVDELSDDPEIETKRKRRVSTSSRKRQKLPTEQECSPLIFEQSLTTIQIAKGKGSLSRQMHKIKTNGLRNGRTDFNGVDEAVCTQASIINDDSSDSDYLGTESENSEEIGESADDLTDDFMEEEYD